MATVSASERLCEARDALHRLSIGESVVEVRDQTGESIRYFPTTMRALERYIAALEREVAGRQPIRSILFRTSKGIS
ncbi:gpW family head-tail joining protein [uncultured Erythrobacter sp.]|uniref:gpW family head-tail joining protein n=1 Tax=uncultured Erythrobacter sp. TaxID=263913 RepID=UPI00345DB6CA